MLVNCLGVSHKEHRQQFNRLGSYVSWLYTPTNTFKILLSAADIMLYTNIFYVSCFLLPYFLLKWLLCFVKQNPCKKEKTQHLQTLHSGLQTFVEYYTHMEWKGVNGRMDDWRDGWTDGWISTKISYLSLPHWLIWEGKQYANQHFLKLLFYS